MPNLCIHIYLSLMRFGSLMIVKASVVCLSDLFIGVVTHPGRSRGSPIPQIRRLSAPLDTFTNWPQGNRK
jgi:hypothetical protein